jgi:hypothetical protein
VASIDAQVASGHETASIAEKEDSCSAVLLRRGQTSKHVVLGPLVAALGVLDEELLNHSGDDITGRDSVDTDVVLAPLGGKVAGELDDGRFASVVGRADETLYVEMSVNYP